VSTLRCGGCGASPAPDDPYPFRCPNAGLGDVDHVLTRRLAPGTAFPAGSAAQTFAHYRRLLHSWHRAVGGGLSDGQFVDLVGELDAAIAHVDGAGFLPTPYGRNAVLSDTLGLEVWVKDETGNVAGSHKARHLMGVLLHLAVSERIGLADPANRPPLAIASCGNAALAAGVLAAAAGRALRVFVPPDAEPGILGRLGDLGAEIVTCPRRAGEVGDPCYLRLQEALAAGAVPFTCQGSENGLVIEGGETLVWEMVSAGFQVDHLVVQVGGGALASACVQGLTDAGSAMPRVSTVQTESAHPLQRAYHRVVADHTTAADAAAHRSRYMRAWDGEPKSVAEGILDDETYDWVAVVDGMLRTGGVPVVVGEERLREAHRLGRDADVPVSATGTAGLAGVLALLESGVIRRGDRVAVLFTGVER
jgi:threonine synthase